jgi:hypothetical protein
MLNKEQRVFAWKVFDRRRTSYERLYQKRIQSALESQLLDVTRKFPEEGLNALQYFQPDKLEQIIKQLYIDVGGSFAVHAYSQVMKGEPTKDQWREFMLEFFNLYAADKVVQINENTVNIIRRLLAEGLEGELSLRQIARNIRTQWGTVTANRALTIARTETVGAANRGVLAAGNSISIPIKKLWIATPDDRTRDSHLEVDGQVVGRDESFIVGGSPMESPGDQGAPPEEVINCRCSMAWVPV